MTHPIRFSTCFIYLFNLSPKNKPVKSEKTPRIVWKNQISSYSRNSTPPLSLIFYGYQKKRYVHCECNIRKFPLYTSACESKIIKSLPIVSYICMQLHI